MSWTTPADLRAQVKKLWERGVLLAEAVADPGSFPRRLNLKEPNSAELAERFAEVRTWITRLDSEAGHYRVVRRTVNHRILGANEVPAEIWVDSLDDALGLIGRRREAERFIDLVDLTREREPALIGWLVKRPLRALDLAEDWPRLLEVVAWLRRRPRPGIYVRQVDIAGVHSKFIEGHRGVLSELLDLVLPAEANEASAGGLGGFYRRFGFRERPQRLRFRVLDPALALLPTGTDQDFTLPRETFARLQIAAERVFITENEINFLAFPQAPRSLVVFGAGYGFEILAEALWLHRCRICYWGDLDTHGFAILDQLRSRFPRSVSFLMDRETLMRHRQHWGTEPRPETRDLPRLTAEEQALYDDLRCNRLGERVRLEQEQIGYDWVRQVLDVELQTSNMATSNNKSSP